MNLSNATLISLTSFGYSAAGRPVAGTPTTINARCSISDDISGQQRKLGAVIESATEMMRLLKSDAPGIEPVADQKAVITVDGSAEQNYRIVHVVNREKSGGLAHWEIFLEVTK